MIGGREYEGADPCARIGCRLCCGFRPDGQPFRWPMQMSYQEAGRLKDRGAKIEQKNPLIDNLTGRETVWWVLASGCINHNGSGCAVYNSAEKMSCCDKFEFNGAKCRELRRQYGLAE